MLEIKKEFNKSLTIAETNKEIINSLKNENEILHLQFLDMIYITKIT
jgi:hypothetical protein